MSETTSKAPRARSKRQSPLREVTVWLEIVLAEILGAEIGTGGNPAKAKLLANELSYRLPPHAFTEEAARDVLAMCPKGQIPTATAVHSAVSAWLKTQKPPETEKRETFLIDERFREDPRFPHLGFMDRSWLARYCKRYPEILAKPDPLWDSADPDMRARSHRVNFFGVIRQNSRLAYEMIAMPPGEREAEEAIFLRERYGAQIGDQKEPGKRRDEPERDDQPLF